MAQSKCYYLGIDGGGTKTEFLLVDQAGDCVSRLVSDGCNPMDIGVEQCVSILKSGIKRVCKDIPLSQVKAFAGIAGGSSSDMKKQIYTHLSAMGFLKFQNDSDSLNIIAAGLDGRQGIAVIMGTGICAFVQSASGLSRVAGWGYYFDNGGSAYNIGRDGLNAYFCAYDGSGAPTVLTEMIVEWLKERRETTADDESAVGEQQYLLGKLYEGGKTLIASFAPMVFAAAERGDAVSQQIIERNLAQAAHIIATAGNKFRGEKAEIPVVIAGGLTRQKMLLDGISKYLDQADRFTLTTLQDAPVIGAINLARKM